MYATHKLLTKNKTIMLTYATQTYSPHISIPFFVLFLLSPNSEIF